jgi:hypothetical protein
VGQVRRGRGRCGGAPAAAPAGAAAGRAPWGARLCDGLLFRAPASAGGLSLAAEVAAARRLRPHAIN